MSANNLNSATITERVTAIFKDQLGIGDLAEVRPDETVKSLGGDELDEIEIIMAVEDDFGIEVSDEAGDSMDTIQKFVDHILADPAAE